MKTIQPKENKQTKYCRTHEYIYAHYSYLAGTMPCENCKHKQETRNVQHDNIVLYGVYDQKAAEYVGPILQYRADAVAIRMFSDVANDPKTDLGKHPEDYELIALGELTAAGIETPEGYPRQLITASAAIALANGANNG